MRHRTVLFMALKYRYATKDSVPAEHAALYAERDGGFVLDVEGIADKAKLDEFRAHNLALKQQLEDVQARFEGIDPAEVRKLANEKRKLEEAQQLKAGEFEKVLDARLKAVKADHDKALAALAAERNGLNARVGDDPD